MIGSTFIIMKAEEEESSLFGGMAVPSWIYEEW